MVAGSSGILAELLPLFIGAATDCEASNASTLLKILSAQVQDLLVDAPGFNGEGSCDGTSVGVGIAWRRVQAPKEVGATLPALACGACVPGARRCSPEGVPEVCVEKPQQVPAFEPEAPCDQDHPTCVEGQCARVEELACGADSVCLALASPGALDGQVYCWGQGDQRQHGQDLLTPLTRPVPLALPGKVRHLAKRYHHACAVLEDGQVYCWGNGLQRQLGPNPPPNATSSPPVAVPLPAKASGVAVGFRHSCALLVNGQVACWGSNETGQLGVAPGPTFSSTPVLVGSLGAPLDGLALLDVGEFHSCAAKGTGELFCWGARGDGVWGYQGKDKKVEPLPVLVEQGAPLEILKLAYSATFVQRQGGKLRGMGVNVEGQLGFPVQASAELFPSFVEVPGALALRRFVISSGEFACGLGFSDELRCWGDNGVAQLGVAPSAPLPLMTPPLATARNICVGGRATCAVDLQGVLRCWGNNDSGQLGRGTITPGLSDPEPVPVGWWQP
ncbi:MAG: hypothetical protein MUF64_03835 [Polyangiaceae bacterium]|nr:hypothetical protein [Polyangiaceae bacterium]